jgi:hypothetical protein
LERVEALFDAGAVGVDGGDASVGVVDRRAAVWWVPELGRWMVRELDRSSNSVRFPRSIDADNPAVEAVLAAPKRRRCILHLEELSGYELDVDGGGTERRDTNYDHDLHVRNARTGGWMRESSWCRRNRHSGETCDGKSHQFWSLCHPCLTNPKSASVGRSPTAFHPVALFAPFIG